jgi:hypothetical protein
MIGPSYRPLPDNIKHSQQTDIHAPGGIRTRNPSKQLPQTQALDHAATGTGIYTVALIYKLGTLLY